MRRLLSVTCFLFLFLFALLAAPLVPPAFAQSAEQTLPPDATPAAPAALDPVSLSALATAIADNADRAERGANDAERYANDASRFFGLFEAFGIVVAIASVALGIYGVTNVFSERKERKEEREQFEAELAEARRRLEEQMASKEQDLQALREQLLQNAEHQHKSASQATLALALLPLGERQYKAQDLKGAADTYTRALALDEDNPLIHYRLGYVHVQSGQLEEAETHLIRSLEIDPEFVLAMAALGYVYRRMGDKMPAGLERDQMHNKGEHFLLEALKRSPKLVDDDTEAWWGSLGGLYRRRGQIDQAIYAYEQAAIVTPHSSYPFSNLALLYMAKHDRAQMLETYKRVERLARGEAMAEVDNYWAYADLLTSRLALGKLDEAEDALISVFDIAPPDSPYALEMLADTLTRLTEALGGDEAAPHIPPIIERIRTHTRNNQSR